MLIVRCLRCKRPLHNKKSIEMKYGKLCYEIIQKQNNKKLTDYIDGD